MTRTGERQIEAGGAVSDDAGAGPRPSRRAVLSLAVVGAAGVVLGACGGVGEVVGPVTGATGAGSGGGASTGEGTGTTATGQGGAGGAGGGGEGGAGGGEQCVALDPSCDETPENPLGPYYRAGAPLTTQLDNPKGTGERLNISGRVYAADCVTPLAGATVEVWQADDDGAYDNQAGDPGPTVWVLRATIISDACGRYAYETIKPGRYLNGAQYRPAHIHYQVSHPDVLMPFVTQLYFVGDPYNDIDSMFVPGLDVALTQGPRALEGVFDVVLPTI